MINSRVVTSADAEHKSEFLNEFFINSFWNLAKQVVLDAACADINLLFQPFDILIVGIERS